MLQGEVQSREAFISKHEGKYNFPWRVIIVSNNDAELANSDMVYRLASPTVKDDFSWIKPGKVAWDWWNDWNLYNVDFKAGINNETYKYYIDFHGTYKPTGLQRTYPNVINFEGVFGLEQMKWTDSSVDQVTYDVTIPFIRMVAGPMDYTQGAMRNATRQNYRPVYSEAMSQGTRCRQLAEYIIFESPLNMLCDNPSNYMNEPECTEFIATVPTVWDNTIAMNGKVSEYVSIARQKGNVWYVGSLTNWDQRSLELDLSFLGDGAFTAEVFKDGVNANRAARDYKKETITIPANRKLTINMARGGGFVMKIMPK